MKALLAAALALLATLAHAQCLVRDPDLQGRYQGPCVNGMAEGDGSASGSVAEYRGGFRAGMKHGKGVKRWLATGDEYSGDFVYDMRHGNGVYRWGAQTPWAGERYEGEYRHDQRAGTGSYVWSTGDRYTGPFERDMPTGQPTPRQIQRTRAAKGRLAVIGKPGTLVCSTAPVGIAHREPVQSEVVQVVDDRLLLRTRLVGGRAPQGDPPLYWDLSANWNPCRN